MPRVRTARRIVAERYENDMTVGLRERKKARLRQQIIETSIKLFRKRGFENTRIDDIVRALEISQPTFFRYFSSKDAVLREVGERGFACIRDRLRSELSTDASTAERLRRLYVSMAKEVEADRSLWQAVVLSGAMDPVRCSNMRGHEEATVSLLREILAAGAKEGRNYPRLSRCSFGGIHGRPLQHGRTAVGGGFDRTAQAHRSSTQRSRVFPSRDRALNSSSLPTNSL